VVPFPEGTGVVTSPGDRVLISKLESAMTFWQSLFHISSNGMVHFALLVVVGGGTGVLCVGGGGGGGQLLQDFLQLTIMYSGRLSHSPALAQVAQLALMSVQGGCVGARVGGSGAPVGSPTT